MKKLVIGLIGAVIFVMVFFFISLQVLQYSVETRENLIRSHLVPQTFDGVRVVQFGDLFLEDDSGLRILEDAVQAINRLYPDVVVFTGNLFGPAGPSPALMQAATELLSPLEGRLGKIAVLGNVDLSWEEDVEAALHQTGFQVLRNEEISLFNGTMEAISFIGLDPMENSSRTASLLASKGSENTFQILLMSQPALAAAALEASFDLQLSGYCQGMALRPETQQGTLDPCRQFSGGTYRFGDQMLLNVNTGLARHPHPSRWLSRPRIDSFLLGRE